MDGAALNLFEREHQRIDALLPGEPLICDGIELPLKHRKKRMDLEARGLTKGLATLCIGGGEATAVALEML